MRTSATDASGTCCDCVSRFAFSAGHFTHALVRRTADQQLLDRFFIHAEVAGIADAHRKTFAAFDGRGDGLTAQRDFDDVLNVADIDAIAGRLFAVDVDFQIAFTDDLVGKDVHGTANSLEHLGDLFGHALNLIEIVAVHLDANHRAHARGEHVDSVDDRLRPDVAPAGHLHDCVHFLDEAVFGPSPEEQILEQNLSLGRASQILQCFRRCVTTCPKAFLLGLLSQLSHGLPGVCRPSHVDKFPIQFLDPVAPGVVIRVLDVFQHTAEEGLAFFTEQFLQIGKQLGHSRAGQDQQISSWFHRLLLGEHSRQHVA